MLPSLPTGYAHENGSIVPTVESATDEESQPTSAPRRHEWLRIVQWPATFLAGVVNTKSVRLSPKVVRALALRALLLISVRDRELHGADIASMLDVSPATVSRHGNVLIQQLGSTAILPGKRSQRTRERCRRAKTLVKP